jgi:hypothetical protein
MGQGGDGSGVDLMSESLAGLIGQITDEDLFPKVSKE